MRLPDARTPRPLELIEAEIKGLEELLEDFRDFIRLRGIQEWTKEHSHAAPPATKPATQRRLRNVQERH